LINLLRKFLGDYLIASYLNVVQESGFDDGYIKEIEVHVCFFSACIHMIDTTISDRFYFLGNREQFF